MCREERKRRLAVEAGGEREHQAQSSASDPSQVNQVRRHTSCQRHDFLTLGSECGRIITIVVSSAGGHANTDQSHWVLVTYGFVVLDGKRVNSSAYG